MFRRNLHLVIVYSAILNKLVFTRSCGRAGTNCIRRTGASSGSASPNAHIPPGANEDAVLGQLPPDQDKPRKRCCPYDFDSSRCKIVDDRVLCGYNMNAGWPQSKDNIKELSDGCRLRNGRLECGYAAEPYHNLRRPPAWDHLPDAEDGGRQNGNRKQPGGDGYSGNGGDIIENFDVEIYDNNEKLYQKKRNDKGVMKDKNAKPQPNCVEIDNRIICKPIT